MINTFFLTVESDGLDVLHDGPTGDKIRHRVRSYDELIKYVSSQASGPIEDVVVMCSSSLDFPDESTDDLAVIALADKVRGN